MLDLIGKTITLTRLRNKELVTYFTNFQYALACDTRDSEPKLKRSQIAVVPVTLQYPEVLLNYQLTERQEQEMKTIHHRHKHDVYLADNGSYVAYFFTREQAENQVLSTKELEGAIITQVSVKTQDIEAVCNGNVTAILSDCERKTLFDTSMTYTLTDTNIKQMKIHEAYEPIEPATILVTDSKIKAALREKGDCKKAA